MTQAPQPAHESARLEELQHCQILDTPPEPALDDVTRLAAYLCKAPIALITLVDAERLWFKSKVGIEASEIVRDIAFCNYTIQGSDPFIIHDTLEDERFCNNPIVAGEPYIRFYAGVPLMTANGYALGSLCVIDQVPRELEPEQIEALKALARQVSSKLELRSSLLELERTMLERSRRKPTGNFLKKIMGGLGLAGAALVAASVMSYQSITYVLQSAYSLNDRQATQANISQLHLQLKSLDLDQHRYILSGNPRYLLSYQATAQTMQHELQLLQQLNANHPKHQAQLAQIKQTIAQEMDETAVAISLRHRQGTAAALEFLQKNDLEGLPAATLDIEVASSDIQSWLQEITPKTHQVMLQFLGAVVFNAAVLCLVFYWIYREITKRHRTQTNLEQERDFTAAVLNTVSALVVVLDPQGRIIRFNRDCEATLGYTLEEVKYQHFWDLFLLPKERDAARETFANLQASQFPNSYEEAWLTRIGERRTILWSNTVLLEAGAIAYVIATGIDLTEEKQAKQTAAQLAAIVESSDDAIISMGLDGKITSWNLGAERMYGFSAEEAKGQVITTLLTPPLWPLTLDGISSLTPRLDCQQAQHVCKDGSIIDVFLSLSLIKNEAGDIVGSSMIARDISDRRSIERMKDEFVSVVSHELRTPLASLRGSLGLLLTGKLGTLSDKGCRMLEIAINNTDRLVHLINDVIDLERLESNRFTLTKRVCDLIEIQQQSVDHVRSMAAQSGVYLDVSLLSVQLFADPDRLMQVLTHLLNNAIKFSPTGSSISLQASLVPSTPMSDTSQVLLTVRDQGRGIPANQLESVFERFRQIDASDTRQQGGTGLGLTICRNIIQQHQGHIWAESTLGEGSIFHVTLPLLQDGALSCPIPHIKDQFLNQYTFLES